MNIRAYEKQIIEDLQEISLSSHVYVKQGLRHILCVSISILYTKYECALKRYIMHPRHKQKPAKSLFLPLLSGFFLASPRMFDLDRGGEVVMDRERGTNPQHQYKTHQPQPSSRILTAAMALVSHRSHQPEQASQQS
jgi:hypothetical protein